MARGVVIVVVALARAASADVTVVGPNRVADRVECAAEALNVSVAANQTISLISWFDDRSREWLRGVVTARIDVAGALIDPLGIQVSEPEHVTSVGSAAGQGQALVAWSIDLDHGVEASRVDAAGTVLDRPAITVASGSAEHVEVGAGTGQFLVAWSDQTSVLVARIAADGSLLDPAPLVVGSGLVRGGIAVGFDGSNYLVVWNAAGIQAARVSLAGSVLDPGGVDLVAQIIGFDSRPTIAFSGSEYLVGWAAGQTFKLRVSVSATPIGSPFQSFSGGYAPSLTFDGSRFLLADAVGGPVMLGFTSTSGQDVLPLTTYANPDPSIGFESAHTGFDGTRALIAFSSGAAVGGFRTSAGTILDAVPLRWSQTLNDQTRPAAAFGGADGYLVTWVDERPSNHRQSVFAARVTGAGDLLDGDGLELGTGSLAIEGAIVAHSAGSGSPFLVVWHESLPEQFRAARVTADGSVLDPAGFVVAAGSIDRQFGAVDLACTDTTCLLAWSDDNLAVRAVRIGLDGTVIDQTPLNLSGFGFPRVATDGTYFLVADGSSHGTIVPPVGPNRYDFPTPGAPAVLGWDMRAAAGAWLMARPSAMAQDQWVLEVIRSGADGAQLGSSIVLSDVRDSGPIFTRIVDDGTELVVVWLYFGEQVLHARRLGYDGRVIGHEETLPFETSSLALAGGGDGSFAVISEHAVLAAPDRGIELQSSFIRIEGTDEDDPSSPEVTGCGCRQSPNAGLFSLLLIGAMPLFRRRRSGRM